MRPVKTETAPHLAEGIQVQVYDPRLLLGPHGQDAFDRARHVTGGQSRLHHRTASDVFAAKEVSQLAHGYDGYQVLYGAGTQHRPQCLQVLGAVGRELHDEKLRAGLYRGAHQIGAQQIKAS
jgi:hypothetical protein